MPKQTEPAPEYMFFVETMVASRTGDPAVIVTVNGADFTVNLSVAEARELALNLLQCAAAAENDAFFVDFLRKQIEADDTGVGAILNEFRKWRDREEETK